MKAYSSSMQRVALGSAVRTPVIRATLCATEADALRTGDALALAVHAYTGSEAPAARVFTRRGLLATRPAAARRCHTDFRLVGHAEGELEASAGESALSASGRGDTYRQMIAWRHSFTAVRAPMQKRSTPLAESSSSFGSPGEAQSPNHAMQRTAGRLALNF